MKVKSETVEKTVKIYDRDGKVIREEITKVTKTFEEELEVGIGLLKRTGIPPELEPWHR